MRKLTRDEVLRRFKEVHGDRYDYSEFLYKSSKQNSVIHCKKHGPFVQSPERHFGGRGCMECGREMTRLARWRNWEDTKKLFLETHGDTYSYDRFVLKCSKSKSIITCKTHGDFLQSPEVHLRGSGCPSCAKNIRKTTESVVKEFVAAHGKKYLYHEVEYVSATKKVKIICPEHGPFWQTSGNHRHGNGCPSCSPSCDKSVDYFLSEARRLHGNLYSYDKAIGDYTTTKKKVRIKCKKHGYFRQSPEVHLRGNGCKKCAEVVKGIASRLTLKVFISKARSVHGCRFGYSQSVYKTSKDKLKIYCKSCGFFFWQTPTDHIAGRGCAKCKMSSGEQAVEWALRKIAVRFVAQHVFKQSKMVSRLRFDFYLPEYGILIEYQGQQHYKPVKFWGGKKGFEKRQKRDQIKRDFVASRSDLDLLEIKYTDFNRIEEILIERLNKSDKKIGQLRLAI